jgi:hypothetical protein
MRLILYLCYHHEDRLFWCESLMQFQAGNRVISFTRRVAFVETCEVGTLTSRLVETLNVLVWRG